MYSHISFRSRTARIGAAFLLVTVIVAICATMPRPANAAPPNAQNLDFTGGAGGIVDTGFTTILPGTERQDGNLLLTPGGAGTLQIHTTSGDLSGATSQTNALAIQYNSLDSYTIGARLRAPLPFTTAFQSGGIFIGKSNTAYIRFTAGFGSNRTTGERLLLEVLDNGKLRTNTLTLPAGTLARVQSSLDLFLTVDHINGRVTALYRIDSDDSAKITQASVRNLPRWLRLQGGTTSIPVYAGLLTTSKGATPIDVRFDWFHLLNAAVVANVSGFKSVNKDGITNGQIVYPGDTLTYTISVTNNGTASTLQVVDPIPVDTTYVAASAKAVDAATKASVGAVTFGNNALTWSGSVASGASVTISFQVAIDQPPLHSSTIQNDATLSNLTLGGLPSTLSATTVVSGLRPDLSGSLYSAAPATVAPDGVVSYTLTVQNSGTDVALNAMAQLAIPAGATLVPGSATATSGTLSQAGDQLTWTASGPLAIDAVVTIAFQVRVSATAANNDQIISQASVQCDGMLPNTLVAQSVVNIPSTTPTATETAIPTETATPTATETAIPTETATPTATETAIPTATETAIPTSTATSMPSDTPTSTATPTATETAIPTSTATPTATETAIPTSTATATATDTVVPSDTPTATPTSTAAPTPTDILVPTNTASPSATLTATPTNLPTGVPSSTSNGPSVTPTSTAPATPRLSPTPKARSATKIYMPLILR
jgi:uncharacterized repeat protein (TIGR01451 family)